MTLYWHTKSASLVFLVASISMTSSIEAFCSPSVVASRPSFQYFHEKAESSSMGFRYHQQQRRTSMCSSLPLQQLEENHHEDEILMYYDLDDNQLLSRARLYRQKIQSSSTTTIDETILKELEEEIKTIRNVFMERHMGLVGFVAKNYVKKVQNLTYDDLIQEGVIGLARAFDKYNPDKNTKFSTYATYWIRATILRGISERDDLVRIPEHIIRNISKISSIAPLMKDEEDEQIRQIASLAGLTESQVRLAIQVRDRRRSGGYVAFQSWMHNSSKKSSSRIQNNPNDKNNSDDLTVDMKLEQESYRDQVKDALSKFLRPKEMEALSWRYGLLEEEEDQQQQQQQYSSTRNGQASNFRDYEAEAEMDLFGSQGLMMKTVKIGLNQRPKIPQKGRWGEAMTFAEVGKQMAVSAEYGRRLCSQAIKKLQRAAEDGRLDPGLLMS